MTTRVLNKSIFLKADRATVWAYLTDPGKLALWFHPPKTALAEGQKLEMFGKDSGDLLIHGDVIAARAPEYLEYTFTVGPMGDAVSTVKWTLTEVAGGTRMALVHEGLPDTEAAFGLTLALDKGWDDHISRMRAHIHGDA